MEYYNTKGKRERKIYNFHKLSTVAIEIVKLISKNSVVVLFSRRNQSVYEFFLVHDSPAD